MRPVVCQPCSPIWRWPCGHGVHAGCIAQTRVSLLTVNGPCYVCRHACHNGALDNFKRAFPFMGLSQILDQVPDDEPLGQVPQAYIPNVAALCCPRLAFVDGTFVTLPSDRRMSYMGMDPRGLMSWTCMTCHKDVHLREIPRDPHACFLHGPMCYVLEVFPPLVRRHWSCCNATQQDDSPLPIDHLRPDMPIDHYQGDMPIADDRRDDRPFRNQDPMMAADIESIEDSIPDEDSFPDRSMDHASVDGSEIEAVLEEAAIEEAAIVQMRNMGWMGPPITEADIEEAAIEEASYMVMDGRMMQRIPIATMDASRLASDAQGDALFREYDPREMDDPDEPFHTGAEVEMFQRIVRDYETAEEQLAMEGLLSGYNTDE